MSGSKGEMRRIKRGRFGKSQIAIRAVSVEWIMGQPEFALGVADARAGRPTRTDYESWSDSDHQWNYERGRQWARLAPRSVVLKRQGKITKEAMRYYSEDIL